MTNLKIKPILTVNWKHAFYNNGILQNLEVVPDSNTSKLMQNLGIFYKASQGALILAISDRSTQVLQKRTMLVFQLKNTNPYFQSITDLPTYFRDKKFFYFSNLDKEVNIIDPVPLHNSEFVSENDLYEMNDPIIEYPLNEHPFGMLHLFIDPELLVAAEEGEIKYEIKFNNRKTYFRYYFLSGSPNPINELRIDTPEGFSNPTPAVLNNGHQALMIVSDNLILLKENYDKNFELTFQVSQTNERKERLMLPNPDPTVLKVEDGKFFSDMYVYI